MTNTFDKATRQYQDNKILFEFKMTDNAFKIHYDCEGYFRSTGCFFLKLLKRQHQYKFDLKPTYQN